MTNLPAGAKIRASTINAALPLFGFATADTTRTSSTALLDATGLTVTLAANSTYRWHAYIAYDAGATGDLKLSWTVPSGTTGHWCVWGLDVATTGSIGNMIAVRATGYGSGNTLAIGGSASFSGALAARAAGYLVTSSTAGSLQLQFAQNTSNATATVLTGGSWVDVVKVA